MRNIGHIIEERQARKICSCSEDATSNVEIMKGWLMGAIRRAHVASRQGHVAVVIYSSIYRCAKCGRAPMIVTMLG